MKIKSYNQLKWKSFVMLTLAGIINAFGVTLFLYPVNLYDSGISGTSMLLSQLTGETVGLSVFLMALNLPLFLFGLKKQGFAFTVYSVYAVAVYSLGSWLITDVLPVDVSFASPLAGTDLLLCALFGGVISGLGSGLTIRAGGAIDGIDVMAVTFSKNMGLSVGSFVMIYNVILYVICGIVLKSWILPLYSIVTYCAAQQAVDFVVEGLDRSKAANIITTEPDAVCAALSEAFGSGITRIDARGGYSNQPKTMLYFVVNRFQITKVRDIVLNVDPTAFITISEVADIYRMNLQAVKKEPSVQAQEPSEAEPPEPPLPEEAPAP